MPETKPKSITNNTILIEIEKMKEKINKLDKIEKDVSKINQTIYNGLSERSKSTESDVKSLSKDFHKFIGFQEKYRHERELVEKKDKNIKTTSRILMLVIGGGLLLTIIIALIANGGLNEILLEFIRNAKDIVP